jgi:hypothetical protein
VAQVVRSSPAARLRSNFNVATGKAWGGFPRRLGGPGEERDCLGPAGSLQNGDRFVRVVLRVRDTAPSTTNESSSL